MNKQAKNDREVTQLARPDILTLKPYVSKIYPNVVKLDANENPFPWPAGMTEELFSGSGTSKENGQVFEFNRYPDGEAKALKQALAQYVDVQEENLLPGNGSDELIQLILAVFGGPGHVLLIHPPTFVMYEAAARVTGTAVARVPLLGGVNLDVEGMLRAAENPAVSVIIICSPNNPTGSLFAQEDILRIVREAGKIVVVDEAYAEFAEASVKSAIREYPNLLVMRTFSKAFGLAGLRLGYLIGQAETIGLINRARQPFNVNAFSQRAGVVALRHLAGYREQIRTIKAETRKLVVELQKVPGLRVYPTAANFILFQPPDPDGWAKALLEKGFLVRNLGVIPVLGKSLRMSVGKPEENQGFLQAIKEIAAGK